MSDDTSAFPLHMHGDYGKGMTLRDYFAAAALTGIIANPTIIQKAIEKKPQDADVYAAHCAYEVADAMLSARKEGA
jgi:transaldolase